MQNISVQVWLKFGSMQWNYLDKTCQSQLTCLCITTQNQNNCLGTLLNYCCSCNTHIHSTALPFCGTHLSFTLLCDEVGEVSPSSRSAYPPGFRNRRLIWLQFPVKAGPVACICALMGLWWCFRCSYLLCRPFSLAATPIMSAGKSTVSLKPAVIKSFLWYERIA